MNGFEALKARFARSLATPTEQDADSVYVSLGNWLHWRGLAEQARPIAEAVRQVAVGRTLTPAVLYQMEDRLRSTLRRLHDLAALHEMPLGIRCDHNGIGNITLVVKVSERDAEAMKQAGYENGRA